MPSWILSADRRRGNPEEALRVILDITTGVRGLAVSQLAIQGPDTGRFRDFVDVAHIFADDPRLLDWLIDELVDALGWTVDIHSVEVLPKDDR